MAFIWTFLQIVTSSIMVQLLSFKYLSTYVDAEMKKNRQSVHRELVEVKDDTSEIKKKADNNSKKSSDLERVLHSYCDEFAGKTTELNQKTLEISNTLTKLENAAAATPLSVVKNTTEKISKPDTRLLRYIKNTKLIYLEDGSNNSSTQKSKQNDIDSFIICFSVGKLEPSSMCSYKLKYNINHIFSLNGFVIDKGTNTKSVFPVSRITFLEPNIIHIDNQDNLVKDDNTLTIYVHCSFTV